jgi:flagellar motor protein MotB
MEELRLLVETFIDFQKDRIRLGGRLRGVFEEPEQTEKESAEKKSTKKVEKKTETEKLKQQKFEGKIEKGFFEQLEADSQDFEDRIEKEIKRALKGDELYTKYLSQIKGIGHMMSAYLIAWLAVEREVKIQGIMKKLGERKYEQKKKKETKVIELPSYAKLLEENLKEKYIKVWMPPVMTVADHSSDLAKYCGIAPGSTLVHGQQIHYNPRLKTLMWKVFTQLLMARGEYANIYDEMKASYEKRCPEPDKGTKKLKVHLTTKNIVMRIFMRNLWLVYRHLNNLPKSEPHPATKGHKIIQPFIETAEGVETLDWINEKPKPKKTKKVKN